MDIVLRAIVIFGFLLVLTRIIGRRALSSLQRFALILLIIVGDAVQQGLTQDDYSLTGSFLAIGTIAVLQVLVSWIGFRFPGRLPALEGTPLVRACPLPCLEGAPIVVVENGEVIERNAKRERLSVDEIREAARLQGIGQLDEVRWGVLETNGQITFIKKGS